MSNSNLVNYTKLSSCHSGARTHSIDRITPHCVVGQASVEGLGATFSDKSRQVSCNYGIGVDGRVGMYVEEKNRSWCSSSNANDQRAVTIECASDATAPYAFKDVVYQKLITLCVDICKRNGKTKLIWFGDKNKTLNYSPKSNEMILTVHRWFANKSCPGDWMYARMGDLASKVTAQLEGGKLVWNGKEWAYQVGGKTDTSFTGLAKNANGTWYVKNGVVDFTYNGTAKNQYGTWNVVNGKVTTAATTTAKTATTTATTTFAISGIKTYSKSQANTKLSNNFTVREFAIKDVNYPCKVDLSLINKLQKIRDYFGKPLNITSGYRCISYNKQIGGASNSYHTKGQAADVYISGLDPELIGLYAQVVLGMKGIGIYHDDLFCHLDTRTSVFYWRNQSCTNQGSSFYGSYIGPSSNKYSIKALQTLLNRRGFNCGTIDGSYGAKTTAAVKAAQKKYGLTADGLAGTKTIKALYGTKW